jgi:hypothetical protein
MAESCALIPSPYRALAQHGWTILRRKQALHMHSSFLKTLWTDLQMHRALTGVSVIDSYCAFGSSMYVHLPWVVGSRAWDLRGSRRAADRRRFGAGRDSGHVLVRVVYAAIWCDAVACPPWNTSWLNQTVQNPCINHGGKSRNCILGF